MRHALGFALVGIFLGLCTVACGDDAPASNARPSSGGTAPLPLGGAAGAGGSVGGIGGSGGSGGGGAPACLAPQLSCVGAGCVNVTVSDAHCGACNAPCGSNKHCLAGKCECSAGLTACGVDCVDLLTDRTHCGSCEQACAPEGTCKSGRCAGADGCFGPAADVTLSGLVIYQSVAIPLMKDQAEITASSRKADVVVGREALLRAFVTLGPGWQPRELSARVQLSSDAGLMKQLFVKATPQVSSTQGDLKTTFNLTLPKDVVAPGVRYHVELVECSEVPGNPAGTARFPATGDVSLGAIETGPLKVQFIPLQVGDRRPDTSDARIAHYKAYIEAIYPITQLEFSLRDFYEAEELDLDTMLDEVFYLRGDDEPDDDVYYFGLAPDADYGFSGVGFIADDDAERRAAVGISWDDDAEATVNTIAHEIGHNHGLEHAPGCGPDDPDQDYPYDDGVIGSWGYDRRQQELLPALDTWDMMTYCDPAWLSDYNYRKIAKQVKSLNGAQPHASQPRARRDFRVLIAPANGAARWGHAHRGATPSGAAEPGIVFDARGAPVASIDVYRIATSRPGSAFLLVPSPAADWFSVQVAGLPAIPF